MSLDASAILNDFAARSEFVFPIGTGENRKELRFKVPTSYGQVKAQQKASDDFVTAHRDQMGVPSRAPESWREVLPEEGIGDDDIRAVHFLHTASIEPAIDIPTAIQYVVKAGWLIDAILQAYSAAKFNISAAEFDAAVSTEKNA